MEHIWSLNVILIPTETELVWFRAFGADIHHNDNLELFLSPMILSHEAFASLLQVSWSIRTVSTFLTFGRADDSQMFSQAAVLWQDNFRIFFKGLLVVQSLKISPLNGGVQSSIPASGSWDPISLLAKKIKT